jgi:hypothetical protein
MHMQRQRQPEPEPERQTEPQVHQPEPDVSDDFELDLALQQAPPRAPKPMTREERIAIGKKEVKWVVDEKLRNAGYLPPAPPPLLAMRTLEAFAEESREHLKSFPAGDESVSAFREAIAIVKQETEEDSKVALRFFEKLSAKLPPGVASLSRAKAIFSRLDAIIDRATISLAPPAASKQVAEKMLDVERFLGQEWARDVHRGVLAIYADEESQTTVLQIGIAQYGPIYITVPRVMRPDDVALRSLRELLGRVGAFHDEVDPLAVIDGSYPALNFNSLFMNSRVIRAPSGNTDRLAANLQKTLERKRLSPGNTTIINSSPATREEYLSIFPADRQARHWAAWGEEAVEWNRVAARGAFGHTDEASREAVLQALTEKENVIVIVAHSDGKTLFMPDPRPDGTTISADYLREHREEITANSPFVYLFSCEAGNLANLENFASTLLECGAAGVAASQSVLGAAEGRTMLSRLLDEKRGQPPIEDFWQAMRDVNFFEMEVFLA